MLPSVVSSYLTPKILHKKKILSGTGTGQGYCI